MGLSRTVSEIDGDFSRKSQFSNFLVFCATAEGLPLGIGYRRRGTKKTRMMGLPGRERSLTISSAVWIQCTNVTDGRTDGQTPSDSKDIARGKNVNVQCQKHVINEQ